MPPTVGRIVLYGCENGVGEVWAAIVTRAWQLNQAPHADLAVFIPGKDGSSARTAVPHGEAEAGVPLPGCWCWPLRTP